jgi:hypothetical protein
MDFWPQPLSNDELMLSGVEFHRQGPLVWKVITVNLKPARADGLKGGRNEYQSAAAAGNAHL